TAQPGLVPKSYRKTSRELDTLLLKAIRERRGLAEQPDDVLGALIKARLPNGKLLTDRDIRNQVLMLIIAGHETTAESLTFAIKEISKRPDIQKKMRDEFNAAATNGELDATG